MSPEDFLPIAAKAARRVASDYPLCDAEELEGDLALYLVENWRYIDRAIESGHIADPESFVAEGLHRHAERVTMKRRAEFYAASQQYHYRPSDVRELLAVWVEPKEFWEAVPIPDDAGSLKGHDGVQMLCDISRVWGDLPTRHRQAIYAGDLLRRDWETVGEVLGIVPDTARKNYDRAVDALTALLNRDFVTRTKEHDGTGSRRVMSNAQSIALTGADYGGN